MGKKRRSFFTLTVAIFVTISLLVMFFSLLDKANARKMASKYLVAVTDGVVNNVDSWFKEKKKMLNLISEMPETIDLFESGVDKYDNRLGLITRQYANIEEIFLADSVGNILQGALISDTIISNLTSLEIWPQFEKNNFNTYLDTYVSRSEQTGKLTCILLKGIFINNELKGFVGFTINWDKFVNKFIVPAQVGETGYLGITDTSGRNIGHHDVSLTLQELYQYPWMKKMIADKNGVQSYKFKNEDKMMAFQQSVQTGWIINASINEDELIRIFEENESFKYLSDIAPGNKDVLTEKFNTRCFFTPKKMGAQTAEANINAGIAAAEQIIAFLEKGDTTFKVN